MYQNLISAITVGCLTGFGTWGIYFLYFKLAKINTRRRSKEKRFVMRRKNLILSLVYLIWQVVFPSFCLASGLLSLNQMGIRLSTLPWGFLFTGLWLVFFYFGTDPLAKWITNAIKFNDKREIQRFWGTNVIGSLDGPIAALHWSGTILPLLIIGFSLVVPFPLAIVFAILGRWALHLLAHFMMEAGNEFFGPKSFLIKGLFLNDFIESVSFLLGGSIVAPMTFHLLGGIVPKYLGAEKILAEKAGVPWDEVTTDKK